MHRVALQIMPRIAKGLNMKYLLIVFGILISLSSSATPISLAGQTIDAYLERVKDDQHLMPIGRIAGFGLDAPFLVRAGDADLQQYDGLFTLNVELDSFILDFNKNARWADGIVFKLLHSSLTSQTASWNTLSYKTNIDGMQIDAGQGWASLDFSLIRFTQDSYFIGYFHSVALPEPNNALLLLACLALLTIKFSFLKPNRNTRL